MVSFHDAIDRQKAQRLVEHQAQVEEDARIATEQERAAAVVLLLGQETAAYLDDHQVPPVDFFEKTTQGVTHIPARTETGLRGRSSHIPARTIPKPVYQRIASGWYLYQEGYWDGGFYHGHKRIGLTEEGVFVMLDRRGRIDSIQPADGQTMGDNDVVVEDVADPRLIESLYEQGQIPEAILDIIEGKGPRTVYL